MTVFPISAKAGRCGKALSGTETTTMSPAFAASQLVAADAHGPSSTIVSAIVSGPRELLSTTWCPAWMARRAMALPICPLPMIPTVVILSASLGHSREIVAVVQIGEQARLGGVPA